MAFVFLSVVLPVVVFFLRNITSVISKGLQSGWYLKSKLLPALSFCYVCGLETF
jgi:hypothetical protein